MSLVLAGDHTVVTVYEGGSLGEEPKKALN